MLRAQWTAAAKPEGCGSPHFHRQWLGARDPISRSRAGTLSEFDDMLSLDGARGAPIFRRVAPAATFDHHFSVDFSMLNGRLAKHYGIHGVDGWTFQP